MAVRKSVVSMLPDEMHKGGGGLDDKFKAAIEEVRYVRWQLPGGKYDPSMFYRVKLRPVEDDQDEDAIIRQDALDENDGLIIQHYSAGKDGDWVPSLDNEDPVDLDAEDESEREGYFAMPTEKMWAKFEKAGGDPDIGPQFDRRSKWSFFVQHLIDCGFPREAIKAGEGDCRVFEGSTFRFDRVPGPGNSGSTNSDGQERKSDGKVLVATGLVELADSVKKGAKKGAAKPAGKPSAKEAASAQTNGSNDVAEQVEAAIIELLSDEKLGGRIPRKKAVSEAIKKLSAKDKPKGLALISGKDYMKFFEGSELLTLDAETDVIELAE